MVTTPSSPPVSILGSLPICSLRSGAPPRCRAVPLAITWLQRCKLPCKRILPRSRLFVSPARRRRGSRRCLSIRLPSLRGWRAPLSITAVW